jgi:hypothetical protein
VEGDIEADVEVDIDVLPACEEGLGLLAGVMLFFLEGCG